MLGPNRKLRALALVALAVVLGACATPPAATGVSGDAAAIDPPGPAPQSDIIVVKPADPKPTPPSLPPKPPQASLFSSTQLGAK